MSQPLMIMELIQKSNCNNQIESELPEFDFVWRLAAKVKQRGCFCGLNTEIVQATPRFNELVKNLSPDSVTKIKKVLQVEKLSFGIIENGRFEIKNY